ncbi:uncharacterized protein LOC135389984 [Ornithodoros turicata]|uniref:uncharacterized protein LOC135389984 n=1 Tax=Ornithodoros turicata TaxID=34597 RepID=UPI00313A13E1
MRQGKNDARVSAGGRTANNPGNEAERCSPNPYTISDSSDHATLPRLAKKRRSVYQLQDIDLQQFTIVQGGVCAAIFGTALLAAVLSTRFKASLGTVCQPCLTAQAYITRVEDQTVSPCEDFYLHVCGQWSYSGEDTFVADVEASGFSALDDALSSYTTSPPGTSWTFQTLALFYQSCKSELGAKRNISYVLHQFIEVSDLTWKHFSDIHDERSFIDVIGVMTIKLDLDPLFNIDINRRGHAFTIKPVARDSLLKYSTAIDIIRRASHIIDARIDKKLVESVLELHKMIEDEYDSPASASVTGPGITVLVQLGIGTSELWANTVDKYAPSWVHISEKSQVTLNQPPLLRNVLGYVFRSPPDIRSFYLFLHILKVVIDIVDISGDLTTAKEACLKEIQREQFFWIRHSFAVHNLVTSDTVDKLRQIYSDVIIKLLSLVGRNHRLNRRATSLIEKELKAFSFRNIFSQPYPNATELDRIYQGLPRKLTFYHSRFVLNTVYDLNYDVLYKADCLTAEQPFFRFTKTRLCASAFVLIPPMYYRGARHSVNYGAVGYLMSLQILISALSEVRRSYSGKERAALASLVEALACYVKSSERMYAAQAFDFASATLGLRAAFEAYKYRVSMKAMSDATNREFFQRACLPLCSTRPSFDPRYGTDLPPRMICNIAVRNLPEFYSAFHCSALSKMAQGGICTLF